MGRRVWHQAGLGWEGQESIQAEKADPALRVTMARRAGRGPIPLYTNLLTPIDSTASHEQMERHQNLEPEHDVLLFFFLGEGAKTCWENEEGP